MDDYVNGNVDHTYDDEVCTCGHPRSAHSGGTGECYYGERGSTSAGGCGCREFESRDEFDAQNPYAP